MQHKRAVTVAGDAPPTVVQLHVVESTEQDAPVNIGAPLFGSPLIDVVGFTVGSDSVTVVPAATSVS